MIDNIIIGNLIEGLTLQDIGIGTEETTVHVTVEHANTLNMFLPRLLVDLGVFKTTSEIKRIHKVRQDSKKIKDSNSRNLWRTLDRPEMTQFKIGKRYFWLIVGILAH